MAIMEYDLTFVHRKGAENRIADALSRLTREFREGQDKALNDDGPSPIFVNLVTNIQNSSDVASLKKAGIKETSEPNEVEHLEKCNWEIAQSEDANIGAMKRWLVEDIKPSDKALAKWVESKEDQFVMFDGLLNFVEIIPDKIEQTSRLRLAVPQTKRHEIMRRFHASKAEGGHFGELRTMGSISRYFWWPRMFSDINEFVSSCITCQAVGKLGIQKAKIGGHVTGHYPFEYMAMDLLCMPLSQLKNHYVLVIMDYFSRHAVTVAVPDKSAETVAKAFVKHVVLIYGPPTKLLSDNGGEFRNKLLVEICKLTDIKRAYTSPYNAQCDGMVERFNRTLLKCISTYVRQDQKDWDEVLPWVTYVYNTTVSTAHGRCPFELVMNRIPNSMLRDQIGDRIKGIKMQLADEVREQIHNVQEMVKEFNGIKKQQEEVLANKSRKDAPVYVIGDVIWITSHVRLWDGAKQKLSRQWRGPWVATGTRGTVNVTARSLGSDEAASSMHVNNIKPFLGNNGKITNIAVNVMKRENRGLTEDSASNMEEWEIESVLQHRMKGKQEMEFLVKWKGYIKPTWVGEHELSCPVLVEAYFSKIVHV